MKSDKFESLLKWIQSQDECEWIEYKVNNFKSELIGEYISAISNSCGYHSKEYGYLVFGIEDETKRFVGTDFYPKKIKIGNQEIENWISTQLNPRIDFNIYENDYNSMHFVIIRVHPAKSMPVNFKGVSYIRVGSYKKKLEDHPEKERKLWSISNKYNFETDIALYDVIEEDVFSLIDYPAFFDLFKIPIPPNRSGMLQKLLDEKIIVDDGSLLHITNLGALLFAKNINAFDSLSRKAFRVIFYDGNNRIKAYKEQVGQKGYASGFKGLIRYIEDQIPTNEVIEKALRKKVSAYPILAIRELIANAIIHQDLTIRGSSPMIEIFDNRIEITNPGKALIDPMRFVDHTPISRNEILARCMRRLNVCEERGSGIDKVVYECEYNQLPAPEFIVGDTFTRVILYKHKTLRQMDKSDKIRACYLHCCLKYVSGEYMTNQSLRERFGIVESNYPMASRIIADTIAANLIKDQDAENKSKKFAKYVPFWY